MTLQENRNTLRFPVKNPEGQKQTNHVFWNLAQAHPMLLISNKTLPDFLRDRDNSLAQLPLHSFFPSCLSNYEDHHFSSETAKNY